MIIKFPYQLPPSPPTLLPGGTLRRSSGTNGPLALVSSLVARARDLVSFPGRISGSFQTQVQLPVSEIDLTQSPAFVSTPKHFRYLASAVCLRLSDDSRALLALPGENWSECPWLFSLSDGKGRLIGRWGPRLFAEVATDPQGNVYGFHAGWRFRTGRLMLGKYDCSGQRLWEVPCGETPLWGTGVGKICVIGGEVFFHAGTMSNVVTIFDSQTGRRVREFRCLGPNGRIVVDNMSSWGDHLCLHVKTGGIFEDGSESSPGLYIVDANGNHKFSLVSNMIGNYVCDGERQEIICTVNRMTDRGFEDVIYIYDLGQRTTCR